MYQYKINLIKTKVSEKEVICKSSREVANDPFIQKLFTEADNDKEKLYVIFLNIKSKITGYSLISMGSLTECPAHPREIMKPVILASAVSIILIHNHPSGDPEPSQADISLTQRVKEACKIMSINFLDHIILGFEADEYKGFYSFNVHKAL